MPPPLTRLLLRPQSRAFTSILHPSAAKYTTPESTILSSALRHVPDHGFTTTSLALGARENGYLDISINLFRRGAFELVLYHLSTQRHALRNRVNFHAAEQAGRKLGVADKIRTLCQNRLRANMDAGVVGRWQEALAIMSLGENVPASLSELAKLSDEMWYLAGDTSVDTSWYTKRAMLSGVYASTEIFMTTDRSPDYEATWEFLDRRLEDARTIGSVTDNVGSYLGFTANALVNILRSKNVRPF